MRTPLAEQPAAEQPGPKPTTLDKLRVAARELFVELGYHETRPQDIARRAGVANGTFYIHFANKQQAFLDFSEQARNELMAMIEEPLKQARNNRERWTIICTVIIDYGAKHPGLLQAAFLDPVFVAPREDHAWRMYDRLGQRLSLVLKHESGSADYDFELLGHGVCGLLRHAMIYAGRRDIDRTRLIENLSTFIDRALTEH